MMATPKRQRIAIWVIAAVMLVGTIGSFWAMILQSKNDQVDRQEQQKAIEAYKKQMAEQQKKDEALSAQYYPEFSPYKTTPATFDANVGDKVTSKDLKVGTGADITADTTYRAYYLGWNPKGKMFDSSFDGDKLKAPLQVVKGGVIEGWSQGTTGMKVGGIREITIPSDLAYGEKGSGDDIAPNTPLKFIVMIVEAK